MRDLELLVPTWCRLCYPNCHRFTQRLSFFVLGVLLSGHLWKMKEKQGWAKKRLDRPPRFWLRPGPALKRDVPESFLSVEEGTIVTGGRSDVGVAVFCLWSSPVGGWLPRAVCWPHSQQLGNWALDPSRHMHVTPPVSTAWSYYTTREYWVCIKSWSTLHFKNLRLMTSSEAGVT